MHLLAASPIYLDSVDGYLNPVVAPLSDGFAVAWSRALQDEVWFEERDFAGERLCEPLSIGTAMITKDMAAYDGGQLIVGIVTQSLAGRPGMLRVLDGCVRGSDTIFLSESAETGLGRVSVAAGDPGFAVVWPTTRTDDGPDNLGDRGVLVRTFGPNFCDDPTPAP
jgi:hypothetical protein